MRAIEKLSHGDGDTRLFAQLTEPADILRRNRILDKEGPILLNPLDHVDSVDWLQALMHVMQQFNIVPKAISGLLEYFHCTIDVGARRYGPVIRMPKSSVLVGRVLRQMRGTVSSKLDTHISVAAFLFEELHAIHHLFRSITRRMAIAIDRETRLAAQQLVDWHSRHFSFDVP